MSARYVNGGRNGVEVICDGCLHVERRRTGTIRDLRRILKSRNWHSSQRHYFDYCSPCVTKILSANRWPNAPKIQQRL